MAGALSPALIGAVVLKGMDELEHQLIGASPALKEQLLSELAGRVIAPYLAMAGVLLVLAYLVRRSGLPEISLHPAAAGGRRPPSRRVASGSFRICCWG
ncbi:MAG: hypothetical protein WKG07_50045 [Hymenobacter sp.]